MSKPWKALRPRAFNMVIPILIMVFMMPVMLATTGWAVRALKPDVSTVRQVFFAIGQGSGSTAVLIAVLTSIIFAMVFYGMQGIMKMKEMVDLTLKGSISGMMPLALLMMLAFAIGARLQRDGHWYSTSPMWQGMAAIAHLVPFIVFLVKLLHRLSTGTSWGTLRS